MAQPLGLVSGVLALGLVALGVLLDRTQPLAQLPLFLGIQLASLSGMGLGMAAASRRATSGRQTAVLSTAALLGWRLAYFPIMVFSGHVASIVEWLLAISGLPILVYPTFLTSVALLHGAAAAAASFVVAPPHPLLRVAAGAAFCVAAAVSFNQWGDLRPLPDTSWSLETPTPAPRAEGKNPYLPALGDPNYWPHQRVVLIAAGLTYETIPPSPWATTVKAVLEALFYEDPYGSSSDRIQEHYLAYHSAHPWIGCRQLSDCPVP